MDDLLTDLSMSGIGCFSGDQFAVALCYADDIVLLAPCASALRFMLQKCELYANSHDLQFNFEKTQLICFRSNKKMTHSPLISFFGSPLIFSDSVTHLGHVLNY